MLHVRLSGPRELVDSVLERIEGDPGVANLIVIARVVRSCDGDLMMFDLAREGANAVIGDLKALGVERHGSLSVDESETVLSDAADEAERLAPGEPADAVIWEAVEERSLRDARLTWTFVSFMVLATMIASVGRYLDQPILIIGAMVVGPEFAPLATICFAIARRRWFLTVPAVVTVSISFLAAVGITWALWTLGYLTGAVDRTAATSGDLTEFIVAPDIWSFLVAALAGVAGVLSLTAAKSSALVGVFISVTTVPAIGTLALTLAVGNLVEASASLVQLGLNLAGIVLAGTLTLIVQSWLWSRR